MEKHEKEELGLALIGIKLEWRQIHYQRKYLGMTYKAIGKDHNLSIERVRNIFICCERKLAFNPVVKHFMDDYNCDIMKLLRHEYDRGYSDGINHEDIPFEELDIAELDISVRAYNALKRNRIYKVKDIPDMNTLLTYRNMGKKTAKEILKAIGKEDK